MTRAADPNRVAGLILAGGRSTRMGQDKALLEWQGASLLSHARTLLQASGVDAIHVGGRPEELDGLADSHPRAGPARAILDAARLFRDRYESLLVIPVDMPLLGRDQLDPLLAARPGQARHWQGQPLPALIPVEACAALHGQDIHSIKRLLAALNAEVLVLSPAGDPAPFSNINTPDALASLNAKT
jgi:molybdopterin-guanine dinucleotide biosynthesis protein A